MSYDFKGRQLTRLIPGDNYMIYAAGSFRGVQMPTPNNPKYRAVCPCFGAKLNQRMLIRDFDSFEEAEIFVQEQLIARETVWC